MENQQSLFKTHTDVIHKEFNHKLFSPLFTDCSKKETENKAVMKRDDLYSTSRNEIEGGHADNMCARLDNTVGDRIWTESPFNSRLAG